MLENLVGMIAYLLALGAGIILRIALGEKWIVRLVLSVGIAIGTGFLLASKSFPRVSVILFVGLFTIFVALVPQPFGDW